MCTKNGDALIPKTNQLTKSFVLKYILLIIRRVYCGCDIPTEHVVF